ncbi:integral membrane protein [Zalerion maritima]|uniref:Integral membrane protein n=1 Tax=Zalerion maritima TaxID=339359 RepID=A0AAD5RVW0_9PEZI|nr:integral membrane protein [Zalerion maritima]
MAGANDPVTLQPWSIATVVSVTALAMVAVGMRILARREKRMELWWDDYMIIWSMIWNLVVVGFIFAMLKCGMGIHATEVETDDIVLMAKFLVVAEILYVFNLVWTKLSFLLFYYRIFRFHYFKIWAYIIGTFVILWVITITFIFIFICVPVQKLWYPDLPGHCINQVGTWIANAVSTIVTDLAILILPLPQVWQLNLGWKKKIAVTGAFLLGFFVIFASAYRFSVLFSYSSLDPTYTLAPTVGWTAIEMSAGIVSACLPTLLPALYFIARKVGLDRLISKTERSTARGESHAFETIGQKGHERYLEATGGVGVGVGPVKNVSSSELSDSELPLRNIRIQKDFKMSGNRGTSSM